MSGWGFDLASLGGLGEAVSEALATAKNELERNVDGALGIPGSAAGGGAAASDAGARTRADPGPAATSPSTLPLTQPDQPAAVEQPPGADDAAATPAKKKVVRKVKPKVAAADDGADGGDGAEGLVPWGKRKAVKKLVVRKKPAAGDAAAPAPAQPAEEEQAPGVGTAAPNGAHAEEHGRAGRNSGGGVAATPQGREAGGIGSGDGDGGWGDDDLNGIGAHDPTDDAPAAAPDEPGASGSLEGGGGAGWDDGVKPAAAAAGDSGQERRPAEADADQEEPAAPAVGVAAPSHREEEEGEEEDGFAAAAAVLREEQQQQQQRSSAGGWGEGGGGWGASLASVVPGWGGSDGGAHAPPAPGAPPPEPEPKEEAPQSRGASPPAAPTPAPAPPLSDAVPSLSDVDATTVVGLSRSALETLALQLAGSSAQSSAQLLRHATREAQLQGLVASLTERNEELALRSSKISEQDFEEVRSEFETRLGAAERKVYALTKERDALRKGSEKLADYSATIKERDGVIKQVMAEGERLAARICDLEAALKRVRSGAGGLEGERDKLTTKLERLGAELEDERRARAKAEAASKEAGEAARADMQALREAHAAALMKAKADLLDAEAAARDAASQCLARKLKESEARGEAMAESLVEMRDALERQRQAADLREEMLKADVLDHERAVQAAETRHQELSAKLPDTARPLLRQIEAMQAAAHAQADAWAMAEEMLTRRIGDAEAKAAGAAERERLASERCASLASRAAAADAQLQAVRAEVVDLRRQLEEASAALQAVESRVRSFQQQAELAAERLALAGRHAEDASRAAQDELAAERRARQAAEVDVATLKRDYERRAAELEGQVAQAKASARSNGARRSGGGGAPDAPTMAAPGYRWVLLKEGEELPKVAPPRPAQPPSEQQQQQGGHAGQQQQGEGGAAGGSGGGSSTSGGGVAAAGGQHGNAGSSLASAMFSAFGRSEDGPSDRTMERAGSASSAGPLLAADAEVLRMELRRRHTELSAMEGRLRELELTRDQLAEELVASTQRSEMANDALADAAALRRAADEAQQRYRAAVEMVGERDEALEEIRSDLADVKLLYRDQIEWLVQQLADRINTAQASTPAAEATGVAGAAGVAGSS
ncbi:hypothetical protein FOA52_001834 [Chlamydomonas sp. UWO 241]|nr:hypothetical protein FOA52_001834 [Chlamydomonas sp. UWO 241]